MPVEYRTLVRTCGRLKGSITRALSYCENLPPDHTIEQTTSRLESLQETWSEFSQITDQLYLYESCDDFIDPDEDFAIYESKYLMARGLLLQHKSNLTSTKMGYNGEAERVGKIDNAISQLAEQQSSFLQQVTNITNTPKMRESELPRINIQPFSGQYKDWPSFKDLFVSAVDQKQSLTKTQKFHYLKSLLRDEAANLVRHIPITENAYNTAWARLNDRFDRPHLIVNSFIETFLNLPTTSKPNASVLRKISDGANEVTRGLEAVSRSDRDCWLIHLLVAKIDVDSRRLWINDSKNNSVPTVEDFLVYLDTRCEELELSERLTSDAPKQMTSIKKPKQSAHAFITEANTQVCSHCASKDHTLMRCPTFLSLSVSDRRSLVKTKALCFNCLKGGHTSYSCGSKSRCRQCNRRHHTLVHSDNSSQNTSALPSSSGVAEVYPSQSSVITTAESAVPWSTTVFMARPKSLEGARREEMYGQPGKRAVLPTALVNVRTVCGNIVTCRALLDSASELSYVTERCVKSIGIPRSHSRIAVSGISSVEAESTRGACHLRIESRVGPQLMDIRAHILTNITSSLPRTTICHKTIRHLEGLPLADPSFNISSQIDILLGAQYVWDIFKADKIFDPNGAVVAVSSIFGWVVVSVQSPVPEHTLSFATLADLDQSLRQFWEIEEPKSLLPADDENIAEQHFVKTHSRHSDGRYIVELPFKCSDPIFSDTYKGALVRLLSVERRLSRDSLLRQKYIAFMKEYINLGHMRRLSSEEVSVTPGKVFYMPHHPVLGRKLRVVFDGSFRDGAGISLNDSLHIGPNIQRNLFAVCFQFRFHRFVFSADIVKMFRQIVVADHHRNFQRILWRETVTAPIEHYQLCTVTYGTSCAPFLAVRVLKQLALDYAEEFPRAARIVQEDFYVDDVLTGSSSEDELVKIKFELESLMSRAGLKLDKWVSNSKLISSIQRGQNLLHQKDGETTKVLGLHWNPERDILEYQVRLEPSPCVSKRGILSEVSRIFDPLGLLAPIVVQYKILFQELWLQDLGWDTELPPHIAQRWLNYRKDLEKISVLSIPRFVGFSTALSVELLGFCDASIRAYSAAVYYRTKDAEGKFKTALIAAKTRVAPLKQVSLPRLELCGALLLTRLIVSVKEMLSADVMVKAWTDSTIVLAWLSQPPIKMKTFVANRTAEILNTLPRRFWNHISSKDNPADCASRGMSANDLIEFHLWWKGPVWITTGRDSRKADNATTLSDESLRAAMVNEMKADTIGLVTTAEDPGPISVLIEKMSSWGKLVRVLAYILRFIKNARRCQEIEEPPLYMSNARLILLKIAQGCFEEDRIRIMQGKDLSSCSKLVKLAPFVGKNGLLRVGGRIRNSELDPDVIHPIILPKQHRVTRLILEFEHKRYFHPGVSALFVIVRQKYWVFGARNLIRNLTFKCIPCFRQRRKTTQQMMADLPAVRVRQALPFEQSGCDYAGPIMLKLHSGRNSRLSKGYICLFVCLTTSAIHLELATDLSTECFLAALRRFMSRRGKCAQIFSDNGRNFLGASRLLDEMHKTIISQTRNEIISASLALDGIRWSYIPPHAPHWGGIWESAVRSVKLHLRRVIGKSVLTFEQMHTLLAQIEAVVNSRPLIAAPDTDLNYLSPSHFLIGRPYTSLPEGDLTNVAQNRLSYWEHVQNMYQGFWQRWHKEYITSLQQRQKWFTREPNVPEGAVVMVKENNSPPSKWLLGKVIEAYPGKDKLTRVLKLRTAHGEIIRPITRVVTLPVN